jgi:hypothetical protein
MKKIITAALLLSALSAFAVESPTPEPYCDCRGVGLPTNKTSHVRLPASPVTQQKAGDGSLMHRIFYYAELMWLIL